MIECKKHEGKIINHDGIEVSPDIFFAIQNKNNTLPKYRIIRYCLDGTAYLFSVFSEDFCMENNITDVGDIEWPDKPQAWDSKLHGMCKKCAEKFIDFSGFDE